MAVQAVLFDVGGPLDLELTHERLMDQAIRSLCEVDDATYRRAAEWAVESFASNTYQAIIWRLLGGRDAERAQEIYRSLHRQHPPDLFELRPGIAALLEELRGRGLRLGIVANQPASALDKLDRVGIGQYFEHFGISEVVRFTKPDPRIFVLACEALNVRSDECIMVGDRIDNDVAPARLLQMRTVLVRHGRHIQQQPRTWHEVPDREAHDTPTLRGAILSLLEDEP